MKAVPSLSDHTLVSIITPVYNHEQFIGQCIDSVLNQTYTNWEQIIVDDGSTDKTAEVVKRYQDPRIRYIYQAHIGVWKLNETYNKALALARGKLIAILEGDDFWPSDKLAVQVPFFNNLDVVLTFGKVNETDASGCVIATSPRDWNWFPDERSAVIERLLVSGFIFACTAMCRKIVLQSIGGFQQYPSFPAVDHPTWLELSLKGDLLPIDHILGYWRRHDGQVTNYLMVASQLAANYGGFETDFLERVKQTHTFDIRLTTAKLQSIYDRNRTYANFFMGRVSLSQSNWAAAHNYFYLSLRSGTFGLRLASLLGLFCSATRTDLEWIIKLVHKLTGAQYTPVPPSL
jgi:glycosyltransferase involved in cell wall biosynthesis